MSAEEGWVVKFIPFSSSVDSPFWVQYCHEKLENIQLSEDPISIIPTYGVDGPPRIQCQENSLRPSAVVPNERIAMSGSLLGFNTLESFQTVDKNKLLLDAFLPKFLEGDVKSLTKFTLLTFPDLKNHKVLYWFGMPALLTKKDRSICAFSQASLADVMSEEERNTIKTNLTTLRKERVETETAGLFPYFVCNKKTSRCDVLDRDCLKRLNIDSVDHTVDDLVFGFFDPAGPISLQNELPMGWPMRNLVAYLSFHLGLGGRIVQILSYRPKRLRRIMSDENMSAEGMDDEGSVMLKIKIPLKQDYEWETTGVSSSNYKVVGWELNARNKPGPRWVNLKPLLDQNHLAIQAADLNLKLMKWRMIPNLDINKLQSSKVLLVGAGTLGCSVARTLLGWGVRSFKILDYGNVSYSNPVRQNLFTLEDCHYNNGAGKSKAVAAAEALKTIAADVEAEGIVLSIPMPGHAEPKESIEKSVSALDKLVQECDIVFLLTDTRESRWLPTLMAAAHDKMLINAALGLDSWLVMRHGGGVKDDSTTGRLGCYFCNDVVAPENSTKNRTLDQQCTVTRPGLAPIASSMAVELMVSLMHHPLGLRAAAPAAVTHFSPTVSSNQGSTATSPLGVMPHQIRGSVVSYTMMTPTVPAFPHCTSCSAPAIEAYKQDKLDLVYQVCHSADSSYIENLCGLTQFRADATEKLAVMDEIDDDWDDEE